MWPDDHFYDRLVRLMSLPRCLRRRRFRTKRRATNAAATPVHLFTDGLEALEPRVLLDGQQIMGPVDTAQNHAAPLFLVDPSAPLVTASSSQGDDHDTDDHVHDAPAADPAHPDDPQKQSEHDALLNLVPHEAATHVAVRSGPWSAVDTWQDMDGNGLGDIPDVDADVLIPADLTVTYNVVNNVPLHTIRVDGQLHFEHDRDTLLVVDTLVVDPGGSLKIGTEDAPVAADVFALIMIWGQDPIDTQWDPTLLSRGLISHGTVEIHGTEKTPFVAVENGLKRKDTELVLAQVPVNWRVGDALVLTGSHHNARRYEQLTIRQIDGNRVTVDPLKHNHTPPDGYSMYVANTSRNVMIFSQDRTQIGTRGHAMFMHSDQVQIHNAGFYGLGRSDKTETVNDPQLDDQGQLAPTTGLNPRGRYSVHFHRNGATFDDEPAVITGSAVVDSPGWGFVNHDSYVVMEDNVSINVSGAGFVTEFGNEIGTFARNLAIGSQGSGDSISSRFDEFDFGHQGHGFWFHGAGVEVVDNIATDHAGAGFVYYGRTSPVEFDAANLPDPVIAGGKQALKVKHVPIRKFSGNLAFSVRMGLRTWHHLRNAPHDARSVIEDFTVWGSRVHGIDLAYTQQVTLLRVTAINHLEKPEFAGVKINPWTQDIIYHNVDLQGWEVGIKVPRKDDVLIRNGYFNNVTNIFISPADGKRSIKIDGNPQFGQLSDKALQGRPQWDIDMAVLELEDGTDDIEKLFAPSVIKLDTALYSDKQLYYVEQGADFIPFKSDQVSDVVPTQLIDQTTQQIWDQHRIAVGATVAPQDAVQIPRINGLIGAPTTYGVSDLQLKSPRATHQLEGYVLEYIDPNGVHVVDPDPIDLQPGWNLITRDVLSLTQAFYVYGDVQPPTFVPSADHPLVINPAALDTGFTVTGWISDDSFGSMPYSQHFSGSDLLSLPVHTGLAAKSYLLLEFVIDDRNGNHADVALELTLDHQA